MKELFCWGLFAAGGVIQGKLVWGKRVDKMNVQNDFYDGH